MPLYCAVDNLVSLCGWQSNSCNDRVTCGLSQSLTFLVSDSVAHSCLRNVLKMFSHDLMPKVEYRLVRPTVRVTD